MPALYRWLDVHACATYPARVSDIARDARSAALAQAVEPHYAPKTRNDHAVPNARVHRRWNAISDRFKKRVTLPPLNEDHEHS